MSKNHTAKLFAELPVAAWWQESLPLRTLHALNPARIKFIADATGSKHSKTILDAGCGGGILSMELARAGHQVTGIDNSANAITAASQKAQQENLATVQFTHTDIFSFCQKNNKAYDLVTCMELVEHVDDPAKAITALVGQLRPGGDLVVSTLNRTMASYLVNIVVAEYMLRLLPIGTHDWQHFITPAEMSDILHKSGCKIMAINGIRLVPGLWRSTLVDKPGHHYIVHARTTTATNND